MLLQHSRGKHVEVAMTDSVCASPRRATELSVNNAWHHFNAKAGDDGGSSGGETTTTAVYTRLQQLLLLLVVHDDGCSGGETGAKQSV